MIDVNVQVLAEEVFNDIAKLIAAIDTTPILDEGGAFLLNRNRQRYLREVDPDEVPWTPSAAAIRRRRRGGTGTLFDTGRLFRSIQLAERVGNQQVISTDVFYGQYYQYGKGGHIQRKFLGVNEDDADVLERLLKRRIEQALA